MLPVVSCLWELLAECAQGYKGAASSHAEGARAGMRLRRAHISQQLHQFQICYHEAGPIRPDSTCVHLPETRSVKLTCYVSILQHHTSVVCVSGYSMNCLLDLPYIVYRHWKDVPVRPVTLTIVSWLAGEGRYTAAKD